MPQETSSKNRKFAVVIVHLVLLCFGLAWVGFGLVWLFFGCDLDRSNPIVLPLVSVEVILGIE